MCVYLCVFVCARQWYVVVVRVCATPEAARCRVRSWPIPDCISAVKIVWLTNTTAMVRREDNSTYNVDV